MTWFSFRRRRAGCIGRQFSQTAGCFLEELAIALPRMSFIA